MFDDGSRERRIVSHASSVQRRAIELSGIRDSTAQAKWVNRGCTTPSNHRGSRCPRSPEPALQRRDDQALCFIEPTFVLERARAPEQGNSRIIRPHRERDNVRDCKTLQEIS